MHYYTCSSYRITNHYLLYPYDKKEKIYPSCINYVMNKLVRSTLYLDKQLKGVKRNRSTAFKLLKLKCPELDNSNQDCTYFCGRYNLRDLHIFDLRMCVFPREQSKKTKSVIKVFLIENPLFKPLHRNRIE